MTRYNHAFDIAFTVISNDEEGEDVTPAMFREGLMRRIAELDAGCAWDEVMNNKPFDTYEMEEDVPCAHT